MASKISNKLYLAAEGGRLFSFDIMTHSLETIFADKEKETLMGLVEINGCLYVGGKTKIYQLEISEYGPFFVRQESSHIDRRSYFNSEIINPDFHQMNTLENHLYVSATGANQIWKYDLDLNLVKIYKINPPVSFLPVKYKSNYNHINNICFFNGNFHVCLNWLTSKQYGPSGIAVLTRNMTEFKRYEYGWESHNFSFINGQKYVLCGSSGAIKRISHKHKAGLMVDGKLVFEHDPDTWFCKDFSLDDETIYIVGGKVKSRKDRGNTDGVIFKLNRRHELQDMIQFPGSGGFCGCLLSDIDFTKNNFHPR